MEEKEEEDLEEDLEEKQEEEVSAHGEKKWLVMIVAR